MDKPKFAYDIQVPLAGATPEQLGLGNGWQTICCADTPEGAGAVVCAMAGNPGPNLEPIRVVIRRVL